MKKWRLFPTLSAPMPLQMAVDKLLFEDFAQKPEQGPIFRIYYSSEPWCSVGYAAEKKSGYFLESSQHELRTLPICRRVTGGGTVLHGNDLIFALCARKEDQPDQFETVESSYLHLHEAVRIAFQKIGLRPDFYQDEPLKSGRDCFLFPVETDLRLYGRKIAGGAQKRAGDVFLHEESIQPPKNVSLGVLEAKLIEAFQEYFAIEMSRMQIEPDLMMRAEVFAPQMILKVSELNILNTAV